MDNTSYIALSRETELWRQLEVVANNMANANTPAYKSEQTMLTTYPAKVKSADTVFGRMIDFTHDYGSLRDTAEGPETKTGAPLDLAIHGRGYFVVDSPTGPRYTRAGHFEMDDTGMVVTPAGQPLLQQNGQPIIIAPNETSINVADDGTISTENGTIGQINVVDFANDQDLKEAGDNTYDTSDTPTQATNTQIVQGMLEQSNVEPIQQMTSMLNIMRQYEAVMNMITGEHDRQLKAIDALSNANANAQSS